MESPLLNVPRTVLLQPTLLTGANSIFRHPIFQFASIALQGYLVLRLLGLTGAHSPPRVRARRVPRLGQKTATEGGETEERDLLIVESFDPRRMAALVWGRATDHSGEVMLTANPEFDIDRTIFASLDGKAARYLTKNRLGVTLFWTESALRRYALQSEKIAPELAPPHSHELVQFMRNECDFATEHADGSFMEHLQFCYEYASLHYKQHSPRVAFLHSILGVGTNVFPMKLAKMAQLKEMLSEFEWLHVQAFPSFLRLIFSGDFLRDLIAMEAEKELQQPNRTKLERIHEVAYRRVIDNAPSWMPAEDLWVQLNYQLMHLLDFIPVSNWTAQSNDIYMQNFALLHGLLSRAGKLQCTLDFDITPSDGNAGLPMSLGAVLGRMIPCSVAKYMSENAIRRYSQEIGHSLKYEFILSQ